MVILLIIVVVVIVAITAKILIGTKKVSMSSNPVDGIRFNGIMGFVLGDSYEFCLSRLRHLDLLVNNDDLSNGICSGVVAWGKNTFNNVNEVRFVFDNKKLTSIVIDIDFSKDGISDMFEILTIRICKVLGQKPYACTRTQSVWGNSKGQVALFRHFIPVLEEESLLIQIR